VTTVVHPGDSLSGRQRLAYILILGALTALGPFTIDTYLPALPTLQGDFNVSTAAIQLTLTATTIGFGVGQLLVGPWSDKIGRRTPLMVATGVHIIACLAAAIAPNVELLGVARALQGIGAAAGGVVAMAMVRDLFGGRPLVRMLSRLALVNGLAPVLAPVLGSTRTACSSSSASPCGSWRRFPRHGAMTPGTPPSGSATRTCSATVSS
jgi:DHA1 family bicyclomycin/chloramphenicol resistance-like MFS transporter